MKIFLLLLVTHTPNGANVEIVRSDMTADACIAELEMYPAASSSMRYECLSQFRYKEAVAVYKGID